MVMNDRNTLQKYCSKVSIDQMFSVGVWGKYLSFEEETALLIKALKKSVIFTVSLCLNLSRVTDLLDGPEPALGYADE